jgi:hypothetical protein
MSISRVGEDPNPGSIAGVDGIGQRLGGGVGQVAVAVKVIDRDVCPIVFITARTDAPPSRARVSAVWRRSWNRIGLRLARFLIASQRL